MYYLTEQNERRSRKRAFLITLIIHLGIGIALFWYATETPQSKPKPAGFVSHQAGQTP